MDKIQIDDSCCVSTYNRDEKELEIGFKFDLDVSFAYDKQEKTMNCVYAYMFDIFQQETIEQHANQFNQLLNRLFQSDDCKQLRRPLNEILIWNKDKSIHFHRQISNNINSTSIVDSGEQFELLNKIQSLFSRILNCPIDDIDINKSFFEQGGTSLKALQIVALLQ
ncbi:hypothetical protein I4U23_012021 [Adineta vaga]|nr:hypothetical protein I4U23_012021 [Adineta vaga]